MSIVALFTANKSLDFAGNPIAFNASGSTGPITSYAWNMDDVTPTEITTVASAAHSYEHYGNRKPSLIVYNGLSASSEYFLPTDLTINPHPHIRLSGTPIVFNEVAFSDYNAIYYTPGTIDRLWMNFGDGSPVTSGGTTEIFYHTYSATGAVDLYLSAVDISGNSSVDHRPITILMGSDTSEVSGYISLCGPDTKRLGPDRLINLTNFLPDYLQESETYDLVKFYEDFLNEMYSGINGMVMTETQINASASELRFSIPDENLTADPRISILGKIARLAELHDPELIDIDFIQFFAKYLGYNIAINRTEIGGFGTFDVGETECSAASQEKYIRFVVSNLPNWYKIKTTKNLVQIMLYSFGLIADIAQYYTKPISQGGYDQNMVNWTLDENDDLEHIPDDWFPTPHYTVKIDIDKSIEDDPDNAQILNIIMQQGDRIIRAIESVRPINTVFHGLMAKTTEKMDAYIGAQTRFSRYIRIDSDGPADFWEDFISVHATVCTGSYSALPANTHSHNNIDATTMNADYSVADPDITIKIVTAPAVCAAAYATLDPVITVPSTGILFKETTGEILFKETSGEVLFI